MQLGSLLYGMWPKDMTVSSLCIDVLPAFHPHLPPSYSVCKILAMVICSCTSLLCSYI